MGGGEGDVVLTISPSSIARERFAPTLNFRDNELRARSRRNLAMVRFVLAAAVFLLNVAPASAFSWDPSREQRALQLVRQFQVTHNVPSIGGNLVLDGRVVMAASGDANGRLIPSGDAIRYRVGSLTKQITAAGVLAMIEDGTIVPFTQAPFTLDTPLRDLFPNVSLPLDAGKITVRQLLTMTSNIPSYTDDTLVFKADQSGIAPAARPADAHQIIELLKTYRLSGPAAQFGYSNTNYFVLALIIAGLKGGDWQQPTPASHVHLRDRILARAGMATSGFVGEPTPAGFTDAPPTFVRPALLDRGAWPRGAGDLISTPSDLARWNIALMRGQVLSLPLVRTMLAPAVPVKNSVPYRDCKYAMGWYACERPTYRFYQHDGVISGFMASNIIGQNANGSWMSVTVLGNTDASVDIVELVREILEIGN